jgi:hypothetical protein
VLAILACEAGQPVAHDVLIDRAGCGRTRPGCTAYELVHPDAAQLKVRLTDL